jgi:hypothetical protein
MRKPALLLAAFILPACDTRTQRDNVHISVANQGTTEAVTVHLEVRRSGESDVDREVVAAAGTTVLFDYDQVTRVALQIYRVSDNFKLFDDFWTADDLRRLDDRVNVTVTP